ncbi:MAG: hypothetical protein DCO96_13475 [Fluviicola sp. XM-24bin1]|nr:MAG: hypothetical protein DCO96_13475 [Fluviicola sp. XM-24bin1]
MNCLTDVGDGIACTETCTDEVRKINSMINQGKRRTSATGFIYLICGAALILANILVLKRFDPFLSTFGSILFLVGVYAIIVNHVRSGKKPLDQF